MFESFTFRLYPLSDEDKQKLWGYEPPAEKEPEKEPEAEATDPYEQNMGAVAAYVVQHVGEAAVLEQLAEEATELAQMALKCARIWRKENPTPCYLEDTMDRLKEEWNDVQVVGDVLKCCGFIEDNQDAKMGKRNRWIERVRYKATRAGDEA